MCCTISLGGQGNSLFTAVLFHHMTLYLAFMESVEAGVRVAIQNHGSIGCHAAATTTTTSAATARPAAELIDALEIDDAYEQFVENFENSPCLGHASRHPNVPALFFNQVVQSSCDKGCTMCHRVGSRVVISLQMSCITWSIRKWSSGTASSYGNSSQ